MRGMNLVKIITTTYLYPEVYIKLKLTYTFQIPIKGLTADPVMGLKFKNQKAHRPHSVTQCNKTRNKKNFKGCVKKKKRLEN